MTKRFSNGDVLDMLSDHDSGEDLDHDSYGNSDDFETESDEDLGNGGESEASKPGNFYSASELGGADNDTPLNSYNADSDFDLGTPTWPKRQRWPARGWAQPAAAVGGGARSHSCGRGTREPAAVVVPTPGWDVDPATFVQPVFTPNEPPGVKNLPPNTDENSPALDFLELFWTDELWDRMVTETNRQAAAVKARKPDNYVAKVFKPLTKPELKAFFGLRISMEMLVHKDRYESYFQMEQNHEVTYSPGFRKVMSRDRFLAIWTMLHLVDENDPAVDKTDKIYKNRYLLNYLLGKFDHHYVPCQQLSIRQYIKDKPIKWGLKSFLLCEGKTGYILNAEIYTGARADGNAIAELGITGNLVVRLSAQYQGQNYCLYTDRFYTSVTLCEHLLQHDILLAGTALTNSRGFPKELLQANLQRGEHEMRYNGRCAAIVWCDKKPIFFVTSTDISQPVDHMLRYDPQQHRRVEVNYPRVVKNYNAYMGGVDKNDQLCKLQRCRRHNRWPRRLTVKMFMWAVFNSHIIYGIKVPTAAGKRRPTFHHYIETLCLQLIGNFHRDTPTIPGRVAQGPGRLSNAQDEPIHLAEHGEGATTNNRCVLCLERNRRFRQQNPGVPARDQPKISKTVFKCMSCNVYLCIGTGDKNCFQAFHTKVRYWTY